MTSTSAPLVYRAASLETAACLWEAVLEMEAESSPRAALIRAAREAIGSSHLRITVIGWTDLVDAAWIDADGCEDVGTSGQFAGSFDWDFVPGWVDANIDWSDPHNPHYAPSPHTAPKEAETPVAVAATLRDALSFIEGFEGEELQEGIAGPGGLIARLRAAVEFVES